MIVPQLRRITADAAVLENRWREHGGAPWGLVGDRRWVIYYATAVAMFLCCRLWW